MTPKIRRTYSIIEVTIVIFLLLALTSFNLLPLAVGNDDLQTLEQANLQLVRSEFLAKDVEVLAYRPVQYHSQAVSELQTVLPAFQQAQDGLAHGDTSLGLPSNPPDDVSRTLLSAQSDYSAIVAAVKAILANPDGPIDITEVNIVMLHEAPYTILMYQASVLIQRHAEAVKLQLIIIRANIIGMVILIVGLNYAFVTRPTYNQLAEAQPINLTDH